MASNILTIILSFSYLFHQFLWFHLFQTNPCKCLLLSLGVVHKYLITWNRKKIQKYFLIFKYFEKNQGWLYLRGGAKEFGWGQKIRVCLLDLAKQSTKGDPQHANREAYFKTPLFVLYYIYLWSETAIKLKRPRYTTKLEKECMRKFSLAKKHQHNN